MNLYELAHHPDAWKEVNSYGDICFTKISSQEQFDMLNEYIPNVSIPVNCLGEENSHNENEFRMHLLFVYFATTPESEWP